MRNDMNLLVINDNRMSSRVSFVPKQILISLHFISFSWNLSKAVREAKVSTGLATFRDVLFWTTRGQLLRNNRIIPVTNIAELVECVPLPYNEEGTKHVP